jgi:geranylgeranyl diphosphate synthase type II
MKVCSKVQLEELHQLLQSNDEDKITRVISIYKSCHVDEWAKDLKQKYMSKALDHLEEVAVLSSRKKPLEALSHYLLDREM